MAERLWRGVAVDQSFDTTEVTDSVTVVRSSNQVLEAEDSLGEMRFLCFEVSSDRVPAVVDAAARTIKPSWYIHLVDDAGSEMIVVFRDRVFRINRADSAAIAQVKEYGVTNGVRPEQIEIERLFDRPFDD